MVMGPGEGLWVSSPAGSGPHNIPVRASSPCLPPRGSLLPVAAEAGDFEVGEEASHTHTQAGRDTEAQRRG